MRKRHLLPVLTIGMLILLLGPGLSAAEPPSFSIVVHSSNPAEAMTSAEVSRLFLRQSTRWKNGQRVLPVNLISESPLRQAFAVEITRKSLSAEKAYWQRLIFSGRGVPPVEVATEDEVLTYVARNPGAIGYVSRGKSLAGVRELEIQDDEARNR